MSLTVRRFTQRLEEWPNGGAQDKGGLIPLHNASSYGHLDIAALLIKELAENISVSQRIKI